MHNCLRNIGLENFKGRAFFLNSNFDNCTTLDHAFQYLIMPFLYFKLTA